MGKMYLILILILPSMGWSGDSPEAILTAIRDAQSGHLSRYPQGIVEARCSDLNHVIQEHNTAELHLEWKGESAHWKYSYEHLDSVTGESRGQRFDDCEFITDGKLIFTYDPEARYSSTAPVGRFSLRDVILDVRPAKSWYAIYPMLGEHTWRDMINSFLDSKRYGIVESDDKGIVVLKTTPEDPVQSRITFDLNQGANVIKNERAPMKSEGHDVPGFSCSTSWISDGLGSFRLKRYTGIQYKTVVTAPERVLEIEILAFNPKPTIAADRFRPESFHLPAGTQVEVFDAKPGSSPRVSQKGKQAPPRIPDSVLKALSGDLKENGTANPSRNPNPK